MIESAEISAGHQGGKDVMKYRTFVAVVATAVLAGLAVNCGDHPNRSNTGSARGGVVLTSPSPIVIGLRITGPSTIAPGQTIQFTGTATFSDGTTADYTSKVTWSASPASMLTVSQNTGVATGQSVGDATIFAAFQTTARAQAPVTVLPANTYRLTGKVVESGLPVQGATIAVQSGVGAGLSTTTDNGGGYRLYGVAGAIHVKFSKPGYVDIVKTFTAVQNDVLDFPEATQAVPIPSLAGPYTMTVVADPACPTDPGRGFPPLPDDLRQPRTYTASMTQNGPSLTVTLTDPQIAKIGNQFGGRVDPDGIEFSVGSNYPYYGYYYGAIFETLSTTQELEIHGQVRAHRNGAVITGALNGGLELVRIPGYGMLANCVAPNNQLTLTPAAQPSRHR